MSKMEVQKSTLCFFLITKTHMSTKKNKGKQCLERNIQCVFLFYHLTTQRFSSISYHFNKDWCEIHLIENRHV